MSGVPKNLQGIVSAVAYESSETPPYDLPFCGACNDHHAKDAVCVSDLESAVIEAAVTDRLTWRKFRAVESGDPAHYDLMMAWHDARNTFDKAVDALIAAREESK